MWNITDLYTCIQVFPGLEVFINSSMVNITFFSKYFSGFPVSGLSENLLLSIKQLKMFDENIKWGSFSSEVYLNIIW